ncbi:hypothetical protein DAEQUDRAFT_738361 [Daedalea quercina L-15889]|uniref:Uncharacterized protein n=1 Tax=Daedalea quercina L-15889 TaxID=1314783 RepID=A0A165Q5C4_9APHY|nr:hypothetical protein DAEQUDRAFT_738361 [Daedalea quercina L-15889]
MYPSQRRQYPAHHQLQVSAPVQPIALPQHQSWYPMPDSYLFSGAASADLLSSLSRWNLGPPEFLLPYHYNYTQDYEKEYIAPEAAPGFSPAPSESSSTLSWDTTPSPGPAPEPLHVTCNAPLVAPVPLPYHSPFFLQYDGLPDLDEDLSHAPYTHRPQKRKRSFDDFSRMEDAGNIQQMPAKRRSIGGGGESLPLLPTGLPLSVPLHMRNARRNSLPKGATRHARPRWQAGNQMESLASSGCISHTTHQPSAGRVRRKVEIGRRACALPTWGPAISLGPRGLTNIAETRSHRLKEHRYDTMRTYAKSAEAGDGIRCTDMTFANGWFNRSDVHI